MFYTENINVAPEKTPMLMHKLNWVLTEYLHQANLTFIEENLGGENKFWNFNFKRVNFY